MRLQEEGVRRLAALVDLPCIPRACNTALTLLEEPACLKQHFSVLHSSRRYNRYATCTLAAVAGTCAEGK
jgi:hypothetical protein